MTPPIILPPDPPDLVQRAKNRAANCVQSPMCDEHRETLELASAIEKLERERNEHSPTWQEKVAMDEHIRVLQRDLGTEARKTDRTEAEVVRLTRELAEAKIALIFEHKNAERFIVEKRDLQAEVERLMRDQRTFPIMQSRRDNSPGPTHIPWSMADRAYSIYIARYGKVQTLERLAERGGFYAYEMDDYLPGWSDEVREITQLRAEIERLTRELTTARTEAREQAERHFRFLLWHNHGHDGLYGDDGEMQCLKCRPTYDYRRAPLEDVVAAALRARQDDKREAMTLLDRCAESLHDHCTHCGSVCRCESDKLLLARIANIRACP